MIVVFFLFSALDFRGEVRVESRGEAVVLDPATMISSSEDGVVVSILFFSSRAFFNNCLRCSWDFFLFGILKKVTKCRGKKGDEIYRPTLPDSWTSTGDCVYCVVSALPWGETDVLPYEWASNFFIFYFHAFFSNFFHKIPLSAVQDGKFTFYGKWAFMQCYNWDT